ncbi:MAG: hypothetical protein HY585_05325 [Candidatus Omnitrophica bacterium]|nr:hypothetical protein [Candidatus Omnitrophota bacterium]
MKPPASAHPGYRFAIALSILIHLFFVATGDAAVFLGQLFETPARTLLITIEPLSKKTIRETALPREMKKKSQKNVRNIKAQARVDKKKNLPRTQRADLNRKREGFESSQLQLDKRILEFENQLADLVSRKESVASRQAVSFRVFDLEKVPARVREDLLPSYLRKMRVRIAKSWVKAVQPLEIPSAVAMVQYRISSNGSIAAVKARLIDGPPGFEETCAAAVQKASPFEPLPFRFDRSVENQFLTVALTFYFRKTKPGKLF